MYYIWGMNNRYVIVVYDLTHKKVTVKATMRQACDELGLPYEKYRRMPIPSTNEFPYKTKKLKGVKYHFQKLKVGDGFVETNIPLK